VNPAADAAGVSPVTWMVAGQFLVYAVGWLICAGLLRERGGGLRYWAAFMLCIGVGFWLVSQRTEARAWAPFVGSSLAFATAGACLWRGLTAFAGAKGQGREQGLTLGLVALAVVTAGPDLASAPWRVAISYGGMAWLIARGTWSVYPALAPEFGRLASQLILGLAGSIVAVLTALVVAQIVRWPLPLEVHRFDAVNPASMFAYVVLAAVFNFAFMGLVTTRLMRQLREQGERDALTNLFNRRALNDHLRRAWSQRGRGQADFTVVVIDLDHFKLINDRLGHHGGDEVLVETARRLTGVTREADVVARYGGEEFVVLMPATEGEGAPAAAQRLHSALRASPFQVGGQPLRVTASVGVATVRPEDANAEACVRRADQALYAAKNTGRDRVVAWTVALSSS
jgi:diguanylate cyclase (GGDEF)-like protein